LGRRLTDCDFRSYSYVSGLRTAAAAVTIAVLPLSEGTGVRMLRNIFRRNRLPVAGFVVVHVVGRSEGSSNATSSGEPSEAPSSRTSSFSSALIRGCNPAIFRKATQPPCPLMPSVTAIFPP